MQEQRLRENALRLYTFLKGITELRTRAVRTLDDYDEVLHGGFYLSEFRLTVTTVD